MSNKNQLLSRLYPSDEGVCITAGSSASAQQTVWNAALPQTPTNFSLKHVHMKEYYTAWNANIQQYQYSRHLVTFLID